MENCTDILNLEFEDDKNKEISFFDLARQGEEILVVCSPNSCLMGPQKETRVSFEKNIIGFTAHWIVNTEIVTIRKTLFGEKTITKSREIRKIKDIDHTVIENIKQIEFASPFSFSTSYTLFEFIYKSQSKIVSLDGIINLAEILP